LYALGGSSVVSNAVDPPGSMRIVCPSTATRIASLDEDCDLIELPVVDELTSTTSPSALWG
jgi:hypothetical protein